MKLCKCHDLPRAQNGQCIVKRRQTQQRYQSTAKGRQVSDAYNRSVKGWTRMHRYRLRELRADTLEQLRALEEQREVISNGEASLQMPRGANVLERRD